MSDHLVSMDGDLPLEFARRHPRGLQDLCRFKATELHFILHHAGPIIFKKALRMEEKTRHLYEHYLLVHTAVRILGDEELFRGQDVIKKCKHLLIQFVSDAGKENYYGPHFLSYNIHNLIHICDDVAFFDRPLYEFSCYQNENHLQTVKALVVTFKNELEQVVKRVDELRRNVSRNNVHQEIRPSNLFSFFALRDSDVYIPDFDFPIVGTYYRRVSCGPIELRTSHPDNTVRIKGTNQIFSISAIVKSSDGDLFLLGYHYKIYEDFFVYPFPSNRIGTWKVTDLEPNISYHRIQEVKCKCVRLNETNPFNGSFIVSPIPIFATSMNTDD